MSVRNVDGPGAPPSFGYTAYRLDPNSTSRVVVLGVLDTTLVGLRSNNHMTWSYESPTVYMFPRYIVAGQDLVEVPPPVWTVDDFRASFFDQTRWSRLVDYLRETDDNYDPLVFHGGLLDRSAMVRWAAIAAQDRS